MLPIALVLLALVSWFFWSTDRWGPAIAVLLVLSATEATAAHWPQKRIAVVDYTGWSAVKTAASRWDAVTVVKLPVQVGNPIDAPAQCHAVGGQISVCFSNSGSAVGYAVTHGVKDDRGRLIAAAISINTYWNPESLGEPMRVFILLHELGHAVAWLPDVCQSGTVMSACTGDVPQYPFQVDADEVNAEYKR